MPHHEGLQAFFGRHLGEARVQASWMLASRPLLQALPRALQQERRERGPGGWPLQAAALVVKRTKRATTVAWHAKSDAEFAPRDVDATVQRLLAGDLTMHKWPKPTWVYKEQQPADAAQ